MGLYESWNKYEKRLLQGSKHLGRWINLIDEQKRFSIRDNKIGFNPNDPVGQADIHTLSYLFVRENYEKDFPGQKIGLETLVIQDE